MTLVRPDEEVNVRSKTSLTREFIVGVETETEDLGQIRSK